MNKVFVNISCSIVATAIALSFPTSTKAFTFYDEAMDGELSDLPDTTTQLGSLALGTNTLKATFNSLAYDYFSFTVDEGQVLTDIILKSWNTDPVFEDIAFIGITEGSTFDFVYGGIANPDPATGLLGWSHLRSTQVGTNKILTEMSLSNLTPSESGLDIVVNEEADSNPYTSEQLANLPDGVTEDILKTNLRNLGTIGTPTTGTGGWFSGATGFELPLGPGDYSIWLRQGSETNMSIELDFNTTAVPVPEPSTLLGIGAVMGVGAFLKRAGWKKQRRDS